MLKKIQKNIEKQNMILPDDSIIAGVSGGADSVCLLLLLCELRAQRNFSIEILHVEHGIRGEESRQDAAFVEKLARQLEIPCQTIAVDVPGYAAEHGLGIEEAARILRYETFEQVAKERCAKIALAHHMEDNAETILFQMARGSSLTGLCGMQPVRTSETGVTYIRPLLSLHRKEIEAYLKQQGQHFCTDSTNHELDYSRNYIRNIILPEMNKLNSQTIAHINETASQLREIQEFLSEEANRCWDNIVAVEGMDILLDLEALQNLHIALQKELIYKAIGKMAGGKKDITLAHVMQVLELKNRQSGKKTVLPNGVIAIRENATLRFFLSDKNMEQSKKDDFVIEVSGECLERLFRQNESLCIPLKEKGAVMMISLLEKAVAQAEIPRKTYTKWMDYDKIKDGFCIRTRQSGDYLIYDESGRRKKLKQYFIDEKIPVTQRENRLLLAQENMVLWVVGGRMSEHLKVTEETKAILEITVKEEI